MAWVVFGRLDAMGDHFGTGVSVDVHGGGAFKECEGLFMRG